IMKMYGTKDEYVLRTIKDRVVFLIYNISHNPEEAIRETHRPNNCRNDNFLSFFIQKGRMFLSEDEAVARHEEIRSLLLPFNDDRIFDKDSGKLLIDVKDESVRTHYNVETDKNIPVFWTISLSFDAHSKSGFAIQRLYYDDRGFKECYVHVYLPFDPAILFATQEEAEAALEKVEPLLHEKPHSLSYWVNDYYFCVNMEDGCFCRESSQNLPWLLWNTYFPNRSNDDSKIFSEMNSVLDSDEGLYKKSNSKHSIELVMRTDGAEWHFRDNLVLINNEWLPISVLFPVIGIHTQLDLYRAFGIETEKVTLIKDNYKDYVGRILASPVVKVWHDDSVNEGTGDVEALERHEIVFDHNTPLPEESHILFDGYFDFTTIEVLLLKNNDDKLVNYLLNIPFFGYDIENDALNGGGKIHNQWEAAINAFQYMATHTRLTHTGRMRLDMALYKSKRKKISSIIPKSENNCDGEYTFASSQRDSRDYVTSRDFIEIIKLLAYKGEGYKTMTDNPVHYPNGELGESILKEVINRRKAAIPEWQQEAKVVNECFEIDYALHCDEPLV
ncbi:MAG: hypothetical protein KBT06_06020, partial [Prevotellaceae bacterium]|nr:hypothetical protein [Candidatus Colivivens equi]